MSGVIPVTYNCGHTQERDVSNKLPEERQGYIDWLKTKDCFDCYKTKNDRPLSEADKRRWVAQRKAEEAQEALDDQQRNNLPPLQGSEKQVPWATRIRFEKLRDSYVDEVLEGELTDDEFEEKIMESVRRIQSAKWWIDHRDSPIEQVLENIEEAMTTGSVEVNENPY